MHFDLSQDQKDIKRTARDLLASRAPLSRVRELAGPEPHDPALTAELVQLGWPGIAVADERDGQGLGAVGLAVLLEELGYACAMTSSSSTMIAAAVIDACGSDAQRERWLPGLLSGELSAGVGSAGLALDAPAAAVVVLIDGDDARLAVEPEAAVLETIDPTRRYGQVSGAGEPLAAGAGEPLAGGEGEPLAAGAAARVRAALAAEVIGLSQRTLEMSVDYAKQRKQFGVPVGSFQAVSHRCAQMLLHTESVRSAAYYAAWAADAGDQRLAEAAALAAATAADASREVTAGAIQVHGGIGFTWEADVHWYYKRAQLVAALLGGAARHRRALAQLARVANRGNRSAA